MPVMWISCETDSKRVCRIEDTRSNIGLSTEGGPATACLMTTHATGNQIGGLDVQIFCSAA